MIKIVSLLALFILLHPLSTRADEKQNEDVIREPAEQRIFTQEYLETITDEQAADRVRKQRLAREHEEFLRHIDRAGR